MIKITIDIKTKLNMAFIKKFHTVLIYFAVGLNAYAAMAHGIIAAAMQSCKIQSIKHHGMAKRRMMPTSHKNHPVVK